MRLFLGANLMVRSAPLRAFFLSLGEAKHSHKRCPPHGYHSANHHRAGRVHGTLSNTNFTMPREWRRDFAAPGTTAPHRASGDISLSFRLIGSPLNSAPRRDASVRGGRVQGPPWVISRQFGIIS